MQDKFEQPSIQPSVTKQIEAMALITKLDRAQKNYLDLCVAQLNKILAGRSKEALFAQKDLRSLERYSQVLQKIRQLLIEKKMTISPGIQAEIKLNNKYESLQPPQEINGQMYVVAQVSDIAQTVINEQGEQVCDVYRSIKELVEIGGRLYIEAENPDYHFVLNDHGLPIRTSPDQSVYWPADLNGIMTATVMNGHGQFFHIDQYQHLLGNDQFHHPEGFVNIKGHIYFTALDSKSNNWRVLNEKNEPVGPAYQDRPLLLNVSDKLYIKAGKYSPENVLLGETIINDQGQEIGLHEKIAKVYNIANQLFFRACHKSPDQASSSAKPSIKCALFNASNQRIGEEYLSLDDPVSLGDRFAFAAKSEQGWVVINQQGEQIGDIYKDLGEVQNVGDQLAFAAKKEDKWFVINEQGEQIGNGTDYTDIKSVSGQIFFTGQIVKNNLPADKVELFNQQGQLIAEHKAILSLHDIGGKFYYVYKDNMGQQVIANEKSREVVQPFKEIKNVMDMAGELVLAVQEETRIEGQNSLVKEYILNQFGERLSQLYDTIYHIQKLDEHFLNIIARKDDKYIREIIDVRELYQEND